MRLSGRRLLSGGEERCRPPGEAANKLSAFRDAALGGYAGMPVPAAMDLVRELVFGAVDCARGLGFEPHPDVAAAAGHLGEWTGRAAITFGRDGIPFYHHGPYDDAAEVMRTLQRTVDQDGFHFLVEAPLSEYLSLNGIAFDAHDAMTRQYCPQWGLPRIGPSWTPAVAAWPLLTGTST